MHKHHPTTRREALRLFAAGPCLLLPERSVLAARRRANQNWARSGAMAGTSSLAISRPDGLDLRLIVNTRNFGGAKAMGEASNDIKRALDSMPPVESSTTQ
jgi:hypothetical protein